MFDLVGKTVGSYRIIEQIGAGGMATVYKAYQPNMDRYVAIKILPVQLANDPEFKKRFQREARAIARLEHAHILPVYDYGEFEGITFIAMRYIEAGTLRERMSAGSLGLEEVNRIIGQIGSALDYAHRMSVIHRDVKPANVLIDNQGDIYLSDFGLARMMEPSQQLTASGVGIGTPAYMSPEQGQGIKVDHRSDIYSLGIILYEMLTGRVPYEAETPMAVVLKHITGDLPLPHEINPNIPETVERVILKALAKDPNDRYQTASEMIQALNTAIRMMSVNAEQQTVAPIEKVSPTKQDVSIVTRLQHLWDKPRGKMILAGGAITLLLVIGFLLLQLPGNVSILATGAPTSTLLVPLQPTTYLTNTVSETSADEVDGLYDDFNNSTFDGNFNSELWIPYIVAPNKFHQENGIMILANERNSQEKATNIYTKRVLDASKGLYVEAKMLLSSKSVGEYAEIGVELRTSLKNGQTLKTVCSISRGVPAEIWCEVYGRSNSAEYTTSRVITNYDVWHTVRIEATAEFEITFYVDGYEIGTYQPFDSERIKGSKFSFGLLLWSPSKDGVIGVFDDVYMGTLQAETSVGTGAGLVPTATSNVAGINLGKLLFQEDFNGNGNQWPTGTDNGDTYYIDDGEYHIIGSEVNSQGVKWLAQFKEPKQIFDDFYLETKIRFVEGTQQNDAYGVLFRSNNSKTYVFVIGNAQQTYSLHTDEPLLWWTYSPKIVKDGTNTIGILCKGNNITVYLNGYRIDSIESDFSKSGSIGFDYASNEHIAIDYIYVWALSDTTETPSANAATSVTPTPESQVGKLVYDENFENGKLTNFSRPTGLWRIAQGENGNHVLDQDNIKSSTNWNRIIFGDMTWKNYIIEYRMRFVDYDPSHTDFTHTSVSFRYNDIDPIAGNYDAAILTNGLLYMGYGSDRASRYFELASTGGYDVVIKQWYKIRVEVIDDTFKYYIDDVEVLEATDTTSQIGPAGFQVGPALHVQFDDVKVWELPK